jgi:hypothetical protein
MASYATRRLVARRSLRKTTIHPTRRLSSGPPKVSLRSRQDRLQGLLAQWGLSIGAAGSQVRAGNRPARPPRSVFLRLPVASEGAVQEGQVSLRRPPAGPRAASAARPAAGACAAACRGQQRLTADPESKLNRASRCSHHQANHRCGSGCSSFHRCNHLGDQDRAPTSRPSQ